MQADMWREGGDGEFLPGGEERSQIVGMAPYLDQQLACLPSPSQSTP